MYQVLFNDESIGYFATARRAVMVFDHLMSFIALSELRPGDLPREITLCDSNGATVLVYNEYNCMYEVYNGKCEAVRLFFSDEDR